MIKSLQQDVSILRQEICAVIEEDDKNQQLELEADGDPETETALTMEGETTLEAAFSRPTLRVRFDDAWTRHCRQQTRFQKFKPTTKSLAEHTSVAECVRLEYDFIVDGPTTASAEMDDVVLSANADFDDVTINSPSSEEYFNANYNSVMAANTQGFEKQTREEQRGVLQEELEKMCIFLQNTTQKEWLLLDSKPEDSFVAEDDDDMESISDGDGDDEHISTANDDDDNDDDESSPDLTEIEEIFELLENNNESLESLTIDDYNLLLCRVAISPELSADAVMSHLLEIYSHITKNAVPNETTYKIILLTLERRISAEAKGSSDSTIVTLLQDMMDFKVKLSSPTLLNLGMRCLERESNLKVAHCLVVEHVLDSPQRKIKVPSRVTGTLMSMIARENEIDLATSLLKKCIQVNGSRGSRFTDQVVDAALRWPDKNRAGQRRDITPVLTAIRDIVMNSKTRYEPSFAVWRNMIVALSRTAAVDPTRWELLRRPYHSLFGQYSRFYPDELLLRLGLKYCAATKDAHLARTLIVRSVDRHVPETSNLILTKTKPSNLSSIFADFTKESALQNEEFPGFVMDSSGFLNSINMINEKHGDAVHTDHDDDEDDAHQDSFAEPVFLSHAGWGDPAAVKVSPDKEVATSLFGMPPVIPEDLGDGIPNETITDTLPGGSPVGSEVSEPEASAPFSFKVFQAAIRVCHAANDMECGREILDALDKLGNAYPKNIESEVWSFALQGFASLGHDADSVKSIFEKMQGKDLEITDETYGALLHSLALARRHEEVFDIVSSLKLSNLSLKEDAAGVPGVSCYNAVMLCHLNSQAWEQVLSTYEDMKTMELVPNGKTTQGLILASHGFGGCDAVREIIGGILASSLDVPISQENCHLALKLLMPNLLRGLQGQYSVDNIQERLRELGDEIVSLRFVCLNLLRSFRQAEIEQKRVPTKNLPAEVLLKRRNGAWRCAMQDILHVAEAQRLLANKEVEDSSRVKLLSG